MGAQRKSGAKKSNGREGRTKAHVGQIRDIIFGDTMRAYDERFARLERKINSLASNLSNDLDRRLVRLEEIVRRETNKLRQRQQKEKEKFTVASKQRKAELSDIQSDFRTQLQALNETLNQEYLSLQSAVGQQAEGMVQLLDETRLQLEESVSRQVEGLDSGRVTRDELAQALDHLAGRLRNGGV